MQSFPPASELKAAVLWIDENNTVRQYETYYNTNIIVKSGIIYTRTFFSNNVKYRHDTYFAVSRNSDEAFRTVEWYNINGAVVRREWFYRLENPKKENVRHMIHEYNRSGALTAEYLFYAALFTELKGIPLSVTRYQNGCLISEEIYYTDVYAQNNNGIIRCFSEFSHERSPKRTTYYYSDEFINKNNIINMILFYDNAGNGSRIEYFYTEQFTRENAYDRKCEFLKDGKPELIKYYLEDELVNTVNKG